MLWCIASAAPSSCTRCAIRLLGCDQMLPWMGLARMGSPLCLRLEAGVSLVWRDIGHSSGGICARGIMEIPRSAQTASLGMTQMGETYAYNKAPPDVILRRSLPKMATQLRSAAWQYCGQPLVAAILLPRPERVLRQPHHGDCSVGALRLLRNDIGPGGLAAQARQLTLL
jgi:hypothetical protein